MTLDSFKKIYVCLLIFISLPYIQAQEIKPSEILEKADNHRGLQNQSFVLEIRIESIIAGNPREHVELISYIDNESNPNNWNTLVRTTAPSQRKGQLMLLEGNRLWFYKPGTRRPIRISPAQRLLGEASAGDVASFNFNEYYTVTKLSDTRIGKVDAYLLEMKKIAGSAAAYDKTKLWVQKKSFYPIQAEFYTQTDRKLKTCYYGGFKNILGIKRVTEMVIVDELRPDHITKIFIQKMKAESLPKNYYRSDQLPNINF